METAVTDIKQSLAIDWIIEEEATTEIIDRLLSLRLKLIGDKGDAIASLTEHLWEERIVAPVVTSTLRICLTTISDSMKRQHMLKHKTRQVPRCHNIRERYETSFCRQCQLSRRRRLIIAIELGVMLVITLTYHQHDIRHPITATVNLYFLAGSLKFYHLVGCQLIRINSFFVNSCSTCPIVS